MKKYFLKMVGQTVQVTKPYQATLTAVPLLYPVNSFSLHVRRKMKSETKNPKNTIGKVGRPAGLTERQKTFKFMSRGRHSNAECARMAGYAESLPEYGIQTSERHRLSRSCRTDKRTQTGG